MIKRPKHLSYEEWLGELGLFNLKKRQVRGGLINVYNCLKRRCQEDGSRLFLVVPSTRARGNREKFMRRKFHLYVRKNLFTVWMTEHWSKLPREVMEFPHWRYSRTVCTVPCTLGWPCLNREVEPDDPLWTLSALPIMWLYDQYDCNLAPKIVAVPCFSVSFTVLLGVVFCFQEEHL